MSTRSSAIILAVVLAVMSDFSNADEPVREVRGIDLAPETATVYVIREQAQWDAVQKAVGKRRMLPIGFAEGESLELLKNVDFEKEAIVAVFWGQLSFTGRNEKLSIEKVTVSKDEILVECRAKLWGGPVTAAYRAWPYHAKIVPRSDLPVRFLQTTEFAGNPKHNEADKLRAIVKAGEWKQPLQP